MKPRYKICWLREDNPKSSKEFTDLLNDGWQIFYGLPYEISIMIVLSKMTDALDGLSMKTDSALLSKEK